MRTHIVATVAGVLIGLALLAWLPPMSSPAVIFLFVLCVAIANAAGVLLGMILKPKP